ncbi:hypothetical protein EYC56_21260 [Xanthomonas oryzae]|nr:hypothetical protein EYC56_21260 [Xanthomonas oryzae]
MDTDQAVVLRGKIVNYHEQRATGDFLITSEDRQRMGLTAVGAALAGSGGAVGLASLSDIKEEATKVEFEVEGRQVSGWLMWSPFKDGDEVEVVAEKSLGSNYHAFAVLRPSDRIIALYPHCCRGLKAHVKKSKKLFIKSFSVVMSVFSMLVAIVMLSKGNFSWDGYAFAIMAGLFSLPIYGLIAYRMSRRYFPFAKMSEAIFSVLGWPHPADIDLEIMSKEYKGSVNKPGFGVIYFKY